MKYVWIVPGDHLNLGRSWDLHKLFLVKDVQKCSNTPVDIESHKANSSSTRSRALQLCLVQAHQTIPLPLRLRKQHRETLKSHDLVEMRTMGGVPSDLAWLNGVMMCTVWPGEKSQDFREQIRSLPLPSALQMHLQMHFSSASCRLGSRFAQGTQVSLG